MDLAKYLVEQLRWKAYYWNPDPDLSVDEKDFEERPRWFIGWYCNWKFADPQPAPGQEDDFFEKSYVKHFDSASPQEKAALYSKARNYASEHSFTARQAKKPRVYGVVTLGKTIPVTDSVTGYRPNIPRGTPAADYLGRPQPNEPAAPTAAAQRQAALRYAAFVSQVKFGFGVVRGGEHTYLFSSGDVYEFHWDAPPADRNAFGVTPLPQWGWESGAIIVPPETQLTLPPEAVR